MKMNSIKNIDIKMIMMITIMWIITQTCTTSLTCGIPASAALSLSLSASSQLVSRPPRLRFIK